MKKILLFICLTGTGFLHAAADAYKNYGFGETLEVTRTMPVFGARGTVEPIKERIDLFQKDLFSKHNFQRLIHKSHKQGLPWILALLTYDAKDGRDGRDYADGRRLHRHLHVWLGFTPDHPVSKDTLRGAEYYTVDVKDAALHATYLGTEKEATKKDFRGSLISGFLSCKQTPEVWMAIGQSYYGLGQSDECIEWHDRAAQKLQSEGKPHGNVLLKIGCYYSLTNRWDRGIEYFTRTLSALKREHAPRGMILCYLCTCYHRINQQDNAKEQLVLATRLLKKEGKHDRDLLQTIAINYNDLGDWDKAIELSTKSVEERLADGLPCDQVFNCLGFAYENKNDIMTSYDYYLKALQQKQKDDFVAPLINILYLYATYQDQCSQMITDGQIRKYAQELLHISSSDDLKLDLYQRSYPERYARALQEAERLVNGSGGSEGSAPASSSCDANTLD